MATESLKYADVILPLAVPQYYTYKIPDDLAGNVEEGSRVTLAFGKRRIYSAIVRRLHNTLPVGYELREIISILDEKPVINKQQLEFWEWIADYYMCTVGEVYKAALPAGLKLESETRVFAVGSYDLYQQLTDSEYQLVKMAEHSPGISIQKITSATGKKDLLPAIKHLMEIGVLTIDENLKEGYKPRLTEYIRLREEWNDEDKLRGLLDKLERRAPGQYTILTGLLHILEIDNSGPDKTVSKEKLLKDTGSSAATMKALVQKGVIDIQPVEISRLNKSDRTPGQPKDLNVKQEEAYISVKQQFTSKDVVLLHGVTSSGKTEIYIRLINEYLSQGKQVLYLLPEIALTAQIIHRLKNVFGKRVGVYHSKFSDAERVEVYQNLCGKKTQGAPAYQVILGVRSSIFLPFSDLGLIIVDEEHENTYKQFDPAPRYNARDAAIVLAGIHSGKVLLGTATPSFETYTNVHTGRYGMVELFDRYLDIQLPEIVTENVREARRKKKMSGHFSSLLLDSIDEALRSKEQVILFQNRRGFAPYLECNTCGWVPHCKNCDVSLTYHKNSNRLICHYCGYNISNPAGCGSCASPDMQTRGFGTEKVEEEIKLIFPGARVARMDLDTTRTRRSYEKIIEDFENLKLDILIGTQMVSKGLDFDHVRVVGILNADNMLNFPDFRSYERSFQLLAQVSGRAGRKSGRGKVILQTGDPENTVIQHLLANDYKGFFGQQLAERQNYKYPPFYRLVKLTLRHKKLPVVSKAANVLAGELRKSLAHRVIGPEFPLISRIYSFHQKCLIIKIERDRYFSERRRIIQQAITAILKNDEFKSLQVVPDVDPYN